MNEKPRSPLPKAIEQLQEQLNQFRLTHARQTKLPEPLWEAAAALARHHGIDLAHPLRLDHVGLKKRLVGASHTAPKAVRASNLKTAFVELPAPIVASFEEGMMEFESARGGNMRIPPRVPENRDWTKLLRAWRETER